MSDQPDGWAVSRLADVGVVRLGRQRSPKNAKGDRMRPYLRAANVKWSGLHLSDVNEMAFTEAESETYELRRGDLLLGEASGSPSEVGKPGQYKGEIDGCCFQNTLLRVRLPDGLLPDFYEHYFREQALSGKFAAGSRGVGIHHLGAAALSDWQIPVAPTAEQERIVTAIEEAFSKLDAGEAGLRTVRQLLKRVREAVLAAAVTGRLVPQDPTDTPATKLLANLGVESKFNWESVALPDGWCLSTLGEVSFSAGYGTSVKCGFDAAGVGVLRIPNIQRGRVDLNDLKRAPDGAIPANLMLAPNDLLIVRTNGSRDLIGRSAPVTRDTGCSFASYLIRFRLNAAIVTAEFASIMLSAAAWRRRLEASAASSAGQYNLSLRTLEPMQVALPPLAEQRRIVAEVDRQFSFIEAADHAVVVGLARSAALRRSVLKAAFEGRLVPQDPSDEPASVLLQRIAYLGSNQPISKGRSSR